LNNGDIGNVSLRGEFYRCDVCRKHHCGEGSKDAHADYCIQSKTYNKFYESCSVQYLKLVILMWHYTSNYNMMEKMKNYFYLLAKNQQAILQL